jgi:transposase
MKYCGIDLASKSSSICVIDENGGVLFEKSVGTDHDGFRQALKKKASLRCVVEASPLAEWAAQTLEKLGHTVVVIDPRKAKGLIKTKKKTDKLDARNLAQIARTGWYTEVHRKSPDARLLRTWLKARQGMVETSVSQVVRLRGLLRANGLRLGQISKEEFEYTVQKRVEKELPHLWPMVAPILEGWRQARCSAEKMAETIDELATQHPAYEYLIQVPGVGPLTTAAFIATIDDPWRFSCSDQVPHYLGLAPSVNQSGEVDLKGHITHDGDGMLRHLLVESATVILSRVKQDFALKRWAEQLKEQKGFGKARVALARKLAVLLHRLWARQEAFKPFPA